ncbi:MAG: winged helix-turn-helix transcriptional regulator [Sulfolobales archaeon]
MSVELRILKYLKENPGATPRLIADALGLPLSQVRIALNRLRDSGHVVRVPGEGYYARVADSTSLEEAETESSVELKKQKDGLSFDIEKLREEVSHLAARVNKLEKEVKEIKVALEALTKVGQEVRPRSLLEQDLNEDRTVKELKSRKIMKLSEVIAIAKKPIDEYVKAGLVVVVSDLAVDSEFYKNFSSKFPIKKLEVSKLSYEERELMNAMIKEGIVYLHCGREYRLTS